MLDEVRWGPRKHLLILEPRPDEYHVYTKVPHDFNALSAEPSN